MFFYLKKVVYLSLYEQERKIQGAGFASLHGEKDEMCFYIQVRNAGAGCEGSYPVYLTAMGQQINIGMMKVKAGCGDYRRKFSHDGQKIVIGGLRTEPEEICAVQVRLYKDRIISGEWKPAAQEQLISKQLAEGQAVDEYLMEERPAEGWSERELPGEERQIDVPRPEEQPDEQEPEIRKKTENADRPPKKAKREELKAVSISSDKWEQLKRQYKTVHPFEDDREFISIELKDFVVLRDAYQRLANNSFLLHGFYNYRHLILGKDYQIGMNGETCFYLGVPGVFFEREKMVAVMFGFEGFESAGPVETGKFGYYLRRVEI